MEINVTCPKEIHAYNKLKIVLTFSFTIIQLKTEGHTFGFLRLIHLCMFHIVKVIIEN